MLDIICVNNIMLGIICVAIIVLKIFSVDPKIDSLRVNFELTLNIDSV